MGRILPWYRVLGIVEEKILRLNIYPVTTASQM
jgi:hypothetical protein